MIEQQNQAGIMQNFVLKDARPKQVTAMEYIERKYAEGYRHIVISAPTGAGKSAMAATACFWAQGLEAMDFENGGYVLVNQKLLQDQYQNDFKKYVVDDPLRRCRSIKSATEYVCMSHGNCGFGMTSKPPCGGLKARNCTYVRAKDAWVRAVVSVTNYPYLMTEHDLAGKLLPRKVLVLDECHGLESQILRFVEVVVSEESLRKWTPNLKRMPDFENVVEFADFLLKKYLPILKTRLETFDGWEPTDDSAADKKVAQEIQDLTTHIRRVEKGANLILNDPDNWVFWQEKNKENEVEAMAKPLDAAPFAHDLVFSMGHLCIHLSAYPGSKQVYCESLGLDPDKVAWMNLNSTFPPKNRPVFLSLMGSMSRKNRDETLPHALGFIKTIMECYPDAKGLIHCASYEIGKLIYDYLFKTAQGHRLLFPQSADDRDPAFLRHKNAKHGSVIISPSMMEGFDFKDDLARWQVIAKVPYLYMGDPQVAAKKEISPEWYDLQAVSSIIQSVGRIVRSETDTGDTYILDSDFLGLYERNIEMFPKWFTAAIEWPKGREPK